MLPADAGHGLCRKKHRERRRQGSDKDQVGYDDDCGLAG
jgi:hypothetical protein